MILRVVITLVLSVAALVGVAAPQVQWLAMTHDFGVINENDGDASCSFGFVNIGDEPVIVVNARATCGCTTPKYSNDAVAPGDTAFISVSYDPVGRPGRFKKKIYINTNTEPARSTLEISGVVVAAEQTVKVRYPVDAVVLKLQRSMVPMGEIYKGKAKTAFLDAYNQSTDTLYPQWHGVPGYLTVMNAPKAVPPGEQVTFTFYLNTLECEQWGMVEDSLTLLPRVGDKGFKVVVSSIIDEDFSRLTPGQRMNAPAIAVMPERLDLERIAYDSGIITREFKIENYGKNALELRRVYTTDAGVTVEVDKTKIKKGKSATATVTIDTSKIGRELLNARITIISNDPERSRTMVRVVAEVDSKN